MEINPTEKENRKTKYSKCDAFIKMVKSTLKLDEG